MNELLSVLAFPGQPTLDQLVSNAPPHSLWMVVVSILLADAIRNRQSNSAIVRFVAACTSYLAKKKKDSNDAISFALSEYRSVQLTRRIERPLRIRRQSGHRRFTKLVIIAVLAVLFSRAYPTWAQTEPKKQADDNSESRTAQKGTEDGALTRITIKLEDVTIATAIGEIASKANIESSVDATALRAVGFDVEKRISVDLESETLPNALNAIVPWAKHPGAYHEMVGTTLLVSTMTARSERIKNALPEWLRPLHGSGLIAAVDGFTQSSNVVSIHSGEHMSDDLLNKLTTLPALHHLAVQLTDKLTVDGLKQLGKLSHLRKLVLHGGADHFAAAGDKAIEAIVDLPHLTDLEIIECGTTDKGVHNLQKLKQLVALRIYQEGRLTDESLKSIGKLNGLVKLDLTSQVATAAHGFMQFSAEGTGELAELNRLKELHLVGHQVSPELFSHPHLVSLSVGGPSFNDICAKRVSRLVNLESLRLSYTAVTDAGLENVAKLRQLRRLQIDSGVITDKGLFHLSKLPTLQTITLRATGVTDKTVDYLSQTESLESISLHGSGRSGYSPGHIMSIAAMTQLKHLPKLRSLTLTNFSGAGSYVPLAELAQLQRLQLLMCDIRESDSRELEKQLQNTVIHHMTGGGGFSRINE